MCSARYNSVNREDSQFKKSEQALKGSSCPSMYQEQKDFFKHIKTRNIIAIPIYDSAPAIYLNTRKSFGLTSGVGNGGLARVIKWNTFLKNLKQIVLINI